MKKIWLLVVATVLFALNLTAHEDWQDLKVVNHKVSFMPIYHASMVWNINDRIIYSDPYGDLKLYEGLPKADAILISDEHPDHYSVETIKALMKEETFFIAPKAVYDQMPEEWKALTTVLQNGEHVNFSNVHLTITGFPMYNTSEGKEDFHVKGRGNGYLLDIDDFRIYISGDTEDTPEMRELKNVDVAFVCMNLPYTMSVEKAADAVKAFTPQVVYPYHYRNKDGTLSDIEKFTKLLKGEEIRVVNLTWYDKTIGQVEE